MRQIILDTETTGLEPLQGHRIIEIGCVELVDRKTTGNHYHQYLQPDREIDEGAIEVHGITNEFLEDKPRFEDVADDFIDFIRDSELIIHNASFDVGFIDNELKLLNRKEKISTLCSVVDTLALARKLHPGQRNSLDALCKRYEIDNSQRTLHGALLDAEILADVYLMMTGGQSNLLLGGLQDSMEVRSQDIRRVNLEHTRPKIIYASKEEIEQHQAYINNIESHCESGAVWNKLMSEH